VTDSIDLITAAGILGLSVETVRKRLQRGTIQGFKAADGTWRVVLDKSVLDKPDRRRRAKPRRPAGQGLDNKLDNRMSRGGQDQAALIDALRNEIQFLRAELQARDQQIDRFQVLLQQHQHQQQPVKNLADHSPDWTMLWSPWSWWRLPGR
jgi:hypothetical protein